MTNDRTLVDGERCVSCERVFSLNSRPVPVCHRDGRLAGRVHSQCAARRSDPYLRGWQGQSPLAAQFLVWRQHLRGTTAAVGAERDAELLADEPILPLSTAQRVKIDFWIAHRGLSPSHVERVERAHAELVAAFWAWHATLPTPSVAAFAERMAR